MRLAAGGWSHIVTSMPEAATVYSMIDSDVVLLVMSDHGIRTPIGHETGALFLLAGNGVPHGGAMR
jgi:hypothetical protein